MDKNFYEVIILGTGPAGLQAAIHASRTKVSVLVLGRPEQSSIYGAHIENYCCLNNITGDELLEKGRSQAASFGTDFLEEDIVEIQNRDSVFQLKTESGQEIEAHAVIFTLGVSRTKLNVPGETELRGNGVSYCVDCDAGFYRNKSVAVTGDGSAAITGALTLIEYTDRVHLIYDTVNISPELMKKLKNSSIQVHDKETVKKINGSSQVESISLGKGRELQVDGIFIELGAKGALELAGFLGIQLDENFKHIEANKKQETSLAGAYAAGDICGPPWQIAKAIGEGCVAGLNAAAYAKSKR